MIDLDALEESTPKEELHVNLGIYLCTGAILYHDWIKLCRWLGVHTYLLPAERTLSCDLFHLLLDLRWPDVFSVGLLKEQIETNYTETQQLILKDKLIEWNRIRKNRPHARLKNAIIAAELPHYLQDVDYGD